MSYFKGSFFRNCLVYALLLTPLWGGGNLERKMVPAAPVKNFKLPMFGEDGYRKWVIEGKEGRYLNEEELDVIGMTLRLFAEGDPVHSQTIIQSPKARIFPKLGEARGEGVIYVTERGGAYSVFGRNWRWNGVLETITIQQEARVTFRESIGNFIE